jgi:hypothetical protein
VIDPTRADDPDIDDLSTARALIASLQDQLTKIQRENAALRHQLDVLCQRLFGKKSERVDARQLQLALEQLANEPGAVTEPIEMDSGDTPVRGHTRRRPTGRRRCQTIYCADGSNSTYPRRTSSVPAGTPRRASASRSPRSSNTSRRASP